MKSNRWYVAAIGVLLLLWLRAEWRSWQLNSEIDRIYLKEVTVKAVDADTAKPLLMVFGGPGTTLGQHWPKKFSVTTADESEFRVRWIDIGPVEVSVSAEGYPEQRLQLDQHSEDRIVVRLRR